jgi:hypothetical protein
VLLLCMCVGSDEHSRAQHKTKSKASLLHIWASLKHLQTLHPDKIVSSSTTDLDTRNFGRAKTIPADESLHTRRAETSRSVRRLHYFLLNPSAIAPCVFHGVSWETHRQKSGISRKILPLGGRNILGSRRSRQNHLQCLYAREDQDLVTDREQK